MHTHDQENGLWTRDYSSVLSGYRIPPLHRMEPKKMRGESAEEQAAGRPETCVRNVCVPLSRTIPGQVSCLFFGKSALVLPLTYTGGGHPTASTYPYKMFSCPTLEEGMRAVQASLSVPYKGSTIFRLAVTGMFVHLYAPQSPDLL